MLDRADPAGVDVDSAVPVRQHGIRPPAVPERPRHGDELLGAPIPVGVGEEAAAPEVLAGEGVRRCHHVPRRAPVRQVVQCRELPCHLKGFVERGVDGSGQADSFGDAGERCQNGEGVRPADHVQVVDAAAVLT